MPELPEIETIKNILEPQIRNMTITNIKIHRPEIIAYPSVDQFCQKSLGQTIEQIHRRGKYLKIMLTNGDHFVVHLRMTGALLVTPIEHPLEKHTHLVFELNKEKELRFSDTRRFGRFWLIEHNETDLYSGIEDLGIEPFDSKLTAQYLYKAFGKRKKSIKGCLLEQNKLAGIGNIYSDEILFSAHIHPARPAKTLTDEEWERLAQIIPECLQYYIDKNTITPEDYLGTKGREYRNTPFLCVYGHEKDPCTVCGTALVRTTISGRSSVWCPRCQEEYSTKN